MIINYTFIWWSRVMFVPMYQQTITLKPNNMARKTNDQVLRAYLKNTDPVLVAITRERLLMVADLTLQSLKREPEKWENTFVHPDLYRQWAEGIKKAVGFND